MNTDTYTYDGDYKVKVVEYMQRTRASIRQTAAYFNIASPPMVVLWQRIYENEGKGVLTV